MKLPLLFFLTLSYLLGIIAASQLNFSLFLLIIIITCFAILVLIRKKFICSFLIFLFSFFVLGMLMTELVNFRLEKSVLAKWVGRGKVAINGVVVSEPRRRERYTAFDFRAHILRVLNQKRQVNEKVRVVLRNCNQAPNFSVGTKLSLFGEFALPSSSANDYEKSLYHQRIKTIFYAETARLDSSGNRGFFQEVIEVSRQKIKEDSLRILKGDLAGLMAGIVLGDTSGISPQLQEDFKTAGLTHILAVSGLNVGMLLAVLLGIFRLLRCRPSFQVLLVTLFVAFYSFLTRNEPSVLRASLMAIIGLIGWLLGQRKDLLTALSAAALFLLVYDPFLLYSVSFQLSFAATLALILLYPILEFRLKELRLPIWLRGTMGVSLAAQLGVIPVIAYYFNQISLISLIANILVVPVTAPVLAIGMASWALSFFSSQLSQWGYLLSFPLLKYMVEVTRRLAQIPMAAIDLPSPSLAAMAVYYLTLGVTFYALSLKKRSWDRRALLLLLLWFAMLVWSQVIYQGPPAKFEASFLDVGQGDAILLRTPQGANILVDGGESPTVLHRALLKKRVRRIDLLILSHPHSDHVGGLAQLARKKKVRLILDSGQIHSSPPYKEFLKGIKERKIPYKIVRRGMEFQVGEEVRVRILHPPQKLIIGTTSDLNNNSVVVKISYKNVSFMFPGDLELEGQKEMISKIGNLKSDVLKVPHHGSEGGAGLTFLKTVKPRIAVICVGKNNPFGHPAAITLRRLKSLGVKIYRTDNEGDVTIVSNGTSLTVK